MSADPPPLRRRLGLGDAVVIGLGAMIGAGVFSAFAPAAAAAGGALLAGLVVAALVAYCNATASAQLAIQYPTSGGTYVYGRERLGAWWGFVAGWGFVVGKTASCAAMALTFAAYAAPPEWRRPLAAGAVVALAAVNYRGITRTARLTRVLVAFVAAALVAFVAIAVAGVVRDDRAAGDVIAGGGSPYGVLQAAGLLFFAFAGYARIATLGEEVRDPARTIPRAIVLALSATIVLYAAVGVALLLSLGPDGLASSVAPLSDAVRAVGADRAVPVVVAAAAAAALGALLALIAGVGRTTLAMARTGDLPRPLAAVHPRHGVPHRAEVAVAAVVCGLVLVGDLREVIGFSSFGVLIYYLVANLSAFTQAGEWRRYPRALQVLGAAGCATLALTLPWESVALGAGVLAIGILWRLWRLRTPHPPDRGDRPVTPPW
jgi:basic amino acid/polyamine antiporter, APA family